MTHEPLSFLWRDIILRLEQDVSRAMLITWFKDTAILGREKDTLVVGLPLPMFLNWHLEHYKELTLKTAQSIDPGIQQVVYQVDLSLRDDTMRTVNLLSLFPERRKARKLPNKPEVAVGEGLRGKILSPRYTMSSFVVGPSNRLAHAASLAVASQPGGKYNPLFIYGGVGLGKTHLLQGIGNEVLRNDPEAIVLYITSEQFTNDVIEAIRQQKMDQLRKRYRQVDLLIIDDIQFFASKDRCQEEFFHTFNTLLEGHRQIIISSDRPPQELHRILEDRLCSRFERGMIADVQRPDFETRVAILRERAKEYEIFLDQKVIEFIAEHVTDSVRSLEGILMQAVALYELEHRMPTVQSIAEIMCKLSRDPHLKVEEVGFAQAPTHAPRFDEVLEGVSRYYSVPIQEIQGKSRVREVMIPRQIAMYIGSKRLKMTSVQLGQLFTGRDHSTVLHAVAKIDKQIQTDPTLLREIRAIEQEIGLRN